MQLLSWNVPKSLLIHLLTSLLFFRNFEINNDSDTIGTYMYEYGKDNKIHTVEKSDVKPTMILDTMDEYKIFGCY